MNKLYIILSTILMLTCSPKAELHKTSHPVVQEYVRADWGRWADLDRDCQDTRQEVLIAESKVPVTFKTERKCKVESGLWIDEYDGTVVKNPTDVDVDHVVSLKEAFDAGGYMWDSDTRKAFFNDLDNEDHLIAVGKSTNRSKGSRGPSNWLPQEKHICKYIITRHLIFEKWNLTMSDEEIKVSLSLLAKNCLN